MVQSSTTVQQNSTNENENRAKLMAGCSNYTYSYQGMRILYGKNMTGGTATITKLSYHLYPNGLRLAKMAGTSLNYLQMDRHGKP